MSWVRCAFATVALLLLAVSDLAAQQPKPVHSDISAAGAVRAAGSSAGETGAAPAKSGDVKLIYEREIFSYPAEGRRDPFAPLTDKADLGPRFEELRLAGIIFSKVPGRSVALVSAADGTRYRLRRGQILGNARVLDIGPLRVVFAVDNFGVVTQEQLELKRTRREGAQG